MTPERKTLIPTEWQKKLKTANYWEKDPHKNPNSLKILRGEDGLPVEYALSGFKADRHTFTINGDIFTIVSENVGEALDRAISFKPTLQKDFKIHTIKTLRYDGLRFFRVLAGEETSKT